MPALWSARRWRRLLVLIDGLGRTSRYIEAVAQDDDAARHRAALRGAQGTGERPPRVKPRLSEFGPTEDLLATVVDRLGDLYAVTVAAASQKAPPRIPRVDRPEVAEDRIRREIRDTAHDTIVALWLPGTA